MTMQHAHTDQDGGKPVSLRRLLAATAALPAAVAGLMMALPCWAPLSGYLVPGVGRPENRLQSGDSHTNQAIGICCSEKLQHILIALLSRYFRLARLVPPARLRRLGACVDQIDDIRGGHRTLDQSRRLYRRHAWRFVVADEIVEHHMQTHHRVVCFGAFAESVRYPSQPTYSRPMVAVLPLDV
jgi:hypothetical protein